MVGNSGIDVEIQSLRQELKLRILLQNLLLQGLPVIFAALSAGAAFQPEASATLCLVFQSVMLAAVLQWCHHGVRTAQIKAFLQEIDPDEAHGEWETWLPAHRPATLLGSRWMVSTKGGVPGPRGRDAAARSGRVTRHRHSAMAGLSAGLDHRCSLPVHESEAVA